MLRARLGDVQDGRETHRQKRYHSLKYLSQVILRTWIVYGRNSFA